MKLSASMLLLAILGSCSTARNDRGFHSKNIILQVKEYKSSYLLQTLNYSTTDTVSIVSLKQKSGAKHSRNNTIKVKESPKIKVGDTVDFILDGKLMYTAAGKMQQLGLFLIVENDTLWSGPRLIPNKFYISRSTVGLSTNKIRKNLNTANKAVFTKNINPEQIVGEWTLCKRGNAQSMIVSNVCQTIFFEKNGGGSVYLGDHLRCSFNWRVERSKIKFDFKDPADNCFRDDNLYYKLSVNDGEILELKDTKIDFTYYLLRDAKNHLDTTPK